MDFCLLRAGLHIVRFQYTTASIQNQTYVRNFLQKVLTKNMRSFIMKVKNEKMFEEKWGGVMERRTQRRVVRKSRKIRKNTFVLLTMALILCLGTLAMGGQKGIQTKTYYECVEVEKGDTLWEIAEKYRMDGQKTEHMVEDILEVNGLKNTNVRVGESIIVPVTKAV